MPDILFRLVNNPFCDNISFENVFYWRKHKTVCVIWNRQRQIDRRRQSNLNRFSPANNRQTDSNMSRRDWCFFRFSLWRTPFRHFLAFNIFHLFSPIDQIWNADSPISLLLHFSILLSSFSPSFFAPNLPIQSQWKLSAMFKTRCDTSHLYYRRRVYLNNQIHSANTLREISKLSVLIQLFLWQQHFRFYVCKLLDSILS